LKRAEVEGMDYNRQ